MIPKQRKVRQEETQPIDDPAELEKALPKGQNFQFIKNINPQVIESNEMLVKKASEIME